MDTPIINCEPCLPAICGATCGILNISRRVTGIALLFYMYMMSVPHRKHAYGPPQPVTEIASVLYTVDDVRTSQETRLCSSTVNYATALLFFIM
jgi:hypothetical protein